MCRQRVPQKNFSDTYNRNRCVVIAFGVAKLFGQPEKAKERLETLLIKYEKRKLFASQS